MRKLNEKATVNCYNNPIMKCFIFLVALVPFASAAQITSGNYSGSVFSPIAAGPSSTFLSLVTADLSLNTGSGNPSSNPFFPVRCIPSDAFSGPCTISAGGSYSATYTNLNQTGLNLTYGGSNYVLGSGSGVPWQLTLTYTPLQSFTYGQLNAAAVSVGYGVTGSLTVANTSGIGLLLDNYLLTGTAAGSARLITGPPTSNALQLNISFAPEPSTMGFVLAGLVSAAALGRRRKR